MVRYQKEDKASNLGKRWLRKEGIRFSTARLGWWAKKKYPVKFSGDVGKVSTTSVNRKRSDLVDKSLGLSFEEAGTYWGGQRARKKGAEIGA